MRIALLDSYCDPRSPGVGGLSDIVWRLATELAALGVATTVVGPYPHQRAPQRMGVTFRSVAPIPHLRPNLGTLLLERSAMALTARSTDCDVLYAVDSVEAAALSLVGAGARTVWHGHSNVLHHSRMGAPWDRTMYHTILWSSRLAAPRVRRVAALGPSVAKWWTALGTPPGRLIVVPLGIDLPPDEGGAAPGPGEPNGGAYGRLLYVGRLSPEKGGVDQLLRAVQIARAAGRTMTLDIAGDGPDRAALERLVVSLDLTDTVQFLGAVSPQTVASLYRRAHLVVLPSRGEMLPRVMLESWAHGTPFLGTPVGAIPDYLVDNVNGFLAHDISPQALEGRLIDILARPSQLARAGRAGRETARAMTWRRAAEALLVGIGAPLRR
jgi:glycosyltransferase involved in cell wall biosynthesis